MFRIWGKIFKDNHLVRDMVYENGDTDINRTKKVFAGIHAFAEAFDLQQPIWLDKNINEFKRVDKTRFEQDNFNRHSRAVFSGSPAVIFIFCRNYSFNSLCFSFFIKMVNILTGGHA